MYVKKKCFVLFYCSQANSHSLVLLRHPLSLSQLLIHHKHPQNLLMKSSSPVSHDDSPSGGFRAKTSALDLNTAVLAQLVQLDEVTGTEPEGPGLLWPVITPHLWLRGDAGWLGSEGHYLQLNPCWEQSSEDGFKSAICLWMMETSCFGEGMTIHPNLVPAFILLPCKGDPIQSLQPFPGDADDWFLGALNTDLPEGDSGISTH